MVFYIKAEKKNKKKKAEEEFRKSFQCQFADDMSENDEEENRTSTSCEFLMIYLNVNLG